MSSPLISISPVCTPPRTWRSRVRTPSTMLVAQRTARAGPSKVARNPSPRVFTSRPLKRAISCRSRVVAFEKGSPAAISKLSGPLRRIHDVGEHHGREHPVRLDLPPRAGQELLDLVRQAVHIARPGHVVIAGKLDVLGSGDARPEEAACFNIDAEIANSVEHEGGNLDRWENMADVDLVVHPHECDGG